MPQYHVDDELALQVEKLAKSEPFESLTFNDALKRIITKILVTKKDSSKGASDSLIAQVVALQSKKADSPKPHEWLNKVPDLSGGKNLTSWKAVCDFLKIDTAGDSARRKLKKWVEVNRPEWPEVPSV